MLKNIKNHIVKKKKASKVGLSPGSLVYVGDEYDGESQIHLIQYNESSVSTIQINSEEEISAIIDPEKVNWLNITGIHNAEVIETIGEQFGIHPLVMEDILNTQQRPKLEVYDDFIFINLKFVDPKTDKENKLVIEQISIILGDNYLLSFQEFKSDSFKPIRKRIDKDGSRLRSRKSDYLLFALIDLIVDHYLLLIDNIGDDIQILEDKIYDRPIREHLHMVMSNKRNLLNLRKIILPIKESLLKVKGLESDIIDPKNKIFFEDIYDHLSTIQESLDLYFELNKSLRESYMSSIGFKTNEVMKLLTIISTLFIPLTFIVGVYGMNFEYMPELSWHNGYFYVWGVMIVITILLILYFKKRKWL